MAYSQNWSTGKYFGIVGLIFLVIAIVDFWLSKVKFKNKG